MEEQDDNSGQRIEIIDRFPHDYFPESLEAFRASVTNSTTAPDEFTAAAMLAASSVGVGNEAVGRVQYGWDVPASLFLLLIGHKGAGKTPTFRKVFAPLVEREVAIQKQALEAMEIEADDDDEANGEGRRPPSAVKKRSRLPYIILSDTTVPAVMQRMAENPRGVLVKYDELSSLFIKAGNGADRQAWSEVYECERRTVHRKSDGDATTVIPRTFATIIGGIQPDLFGTTRSRRGEDGLIDRFLIVGLPDARLPRWSDDAVDPELNDAWSVAVNALFEIANAQDFPGRGSPAEIRFSERARDRLRDFHERLCWLMTACGVGEAHYGLVGKVKANAARLALIRRCLRWSTGEFGVFGAVGLIDESDVDAACRAAEFFLSRMLLWRPELTRAPANTRSGDPDIATAVHGYVVSRGRSAVSVRDLQQAKLRNGLRAEDLRAACNVLAQRGQLRWLDARQSEFVIVTPGAEEPLAPESLPRDSSISATGIGGEKIQ